MARPHPVVGLTSELTGRCRRSAHKPYVPVYLIYYNIFLVVIIETGNLHLAVRILLLYLLQQCIGLILFQLGNISHAL